jgi:hypothetical protein
MSIVQLPGTEPKTTFIAAVEQMRKEFPSQLEYIDMRATLTRRAYQKLIDEGFTKMEALTLCVKLSGGN